jgi:protoporphyrinogen oxidase
VIIGGGPAGLTAAYQLSRLGISSTVIEKDEVVGGISRTVSYRGFRFDIGGHRFFTKIPQVRELWHELLGDELLTRPRLSRVYYRNQFFRYPLEPMDALKKLGLLDSAAVGASYLQSRIAPHPTEENFEHWVCNRFGRRLYEIFFKTYTEKVWGIPATEISADWAAQRIQNLSLGVAIRNALLPKKSSGLVKTLIDRFEYPRLGPGQMWERCRDVVRERGHRVAMGREVSRIRHEGGKVVSITLRDADGRQEVLPASQVISSMALSDVVKYLDPAPPSQIIAAAERLRYRDFLTVSLVVDQPELFADNWIYVHSPEVRLGRIQNFKNWSPDMVPDQRKTCLGLEYFVWEGHDLWTMSDEALLELGTRELEQLKLVSPRDVSDGAVVRMRRAYPVYDAHYRSAIEIIRSYLDGLSNLQQVGRNGQHRYNNQDHSMLTAMLAVENLTGERHDVWNVNVDDEYHETMQRAQPRRIAPAAAASHTPAEAVARS